MTAVILGIMAPPLMLGLSATHDAARSARNRVVARNLLASQLEAFRGECRASVAKSGDVTTSYVPVGAPPVTVVRSTAIASVGGYKLATCEAVATWTEMRGGQPVTARLALGTAMRAGALP